MFKALTYSADVDLLRDMRREIYSGAGYYIVHQFIPSEMALNAAARWFSGDYNYYFSDYIRNQDIRRDSPNYFIARPNAHDWTFANHLWNDPIDEVTHSVVLEAQQIRNLVENRPLHFGLRSFDPLLLQYRVGRTLSADVAVKPHADFIEEYRADPTGSHAFDPRRCQMTLFLSNASEHYRSGGFKFETNSGEHVTFGEDVAVSAGDLVIWKYSNRHEVSGVQALDSTLGFARIIFPQFDASSLDAIA